MAAANGKVTQNGAVSVRGMRAKVADITSLIADIATLRRSIGR